MRRNWSSGSRETIVTGVLLVWLAKQNWMDFKVQHRSCRKLWLSIAFIAGKYLFSWPSWKEQTVSLCLISSAFASCLTMATVHTELITIHNWHLNCTDYTVQGLYDERLDWPRSDTLQWIMLVWSSPVETKQNYWCWPQQKLPGIGSKPGLGELIAATKMDSVSGKIEAYIVCGLLVSALLKCQDVEHKLYWA